MPRSAREHSRDPIADLRRIAFLLERAHESTYRVRAFRGAIVALARRDPDDGRPVAAAGDLQAAARASATSRPAASSSRCAGEEPAYLQRLEATRRPSRSTRPRTSCARRCAATATATPTPPTAARRSTRWSRPRAGSGHEYLVVTDHSPRLTVANGLSADRLRAQLDADRRAQRGARPTPGSGCSPGSRSTSSRTARLDQDPDLLAELDLVVASVHSKLRMPAAEMTERMLTAVANPHVDVLGHCTGPHGHGQPQAPGVAVRRRRRVRRLRRARGRRRDQLPAGAARPAEAAAAAGGRGGLRRSRSTPTRTRPASSTGCATAASGPSSARCPPIGCSTRGRSRSCWPPPGRVADLAPGGRCPLRCAWAAGGEWVWGRHPPPTHDGYPPPTR